MSAVICVTCGQAVGDSGDQDLAEAMASHRCPLILPCAGCGLPYDRADMLEAYIPEATVTMSGIASPFSFTPMRLDWVGPCCSVLANEWQP